MKNSLLFFTLLFNLMLQAQTANSAFLHVCEENTDGFATFDLSQANSQVLGDQLPENYTISYFMTQVDAETNVNPLQNPYSNTVPFQQTIYARVEALATGNFAISEVELQVGEAFEVQEGPTLVAPDDGGDGQTQFDLTTNIPLILGDLNPAEYTVHFYDSLQNLENRENEIENPENYTNQHNPTIIYVLVENNSGCSAMSSFQIQPLPSSGDEDLDLVPNGFEDVNMNGNLTDDDTDNNGMPNYLDDDDDGDGVLTADEDYNQNGDPTDDDTNNDGVPDYLENSVALNVSKFAKSTFSVYPNPTQGSLFIEFKNPIRVLKIMIDDITGKTAKQIELKKTIKKTHVDLNALEPGIYFFSIVTKTQKITKKISVE